MSTIILFTLVFLAVAVTATIWHQDTEIVKLENEVKQLEIKIINLKRRLP